MTCELAGFRIKCAGPIQDGHIINKGRTRNNKRARVVVDTLYPDVFHARECAAHNQGRWADTREARALLMASRVREYGEDYVRTACECLRICFKGDAPDLRLEALLDA